MQYEVIGIGSGFFAHILATLLACWSRMLRLAAIVGVVVVATAEVVAFALTHTFPPSVTTHVVAALLGGALAYGAAATLFAGELIRGALRAVRLLEGDPVARREEASLTPERQAVGMGEALVTPLPIAAQSARALTPSAPRIQTSLPLAPAAPRMPVASPSRALNWASPASAPLAPVSALPPFASLENDPTLPVTICEEESATVLLLPEMAGMSAAWGAGTPAMPTVQPYRAAGTPWTGVTEAASRVDALSTPTVPPPLPERYALYRRHAPIAPLQAVAPSAPLAPLAPLPLAPAAPDPVAVGSGARDAAASRTEQRGWRLLMRR